MKVFIGCVQPPPGLGEDFHGHIRQAAGTSDEMWTCMHVHSTCEDAEMCATEHATLKGWEIVPKAG